MKSVFSFEPAEEWSVAYPSRVIEGKPNKAYFLSLHILTSKCAKNLYYIHVDRIGFSTGIPNRFTNLKAMEAALARGGKYVRAAHSTPHCPSDETNKPQPE